MVLVYTTPTCAFCRPAKEFLQRKGVAFKEFPIEVSQFTHAPTIVVEDEILSGLDYGLLVRSLTAHNLM